MTPDERRAALGAFEAEHGAYGHESWQIKNRITELERDETRAENEDAAAGRSRRGKPGREHARLTGRVDRRSLTKSKAAY